MKLITHRHLTWKLRIRGANLYSHYMLSVREKEKLNFFFFCKICCLFHQGRSLVKTEAENVAYTAVHIYQITRCHIQRTDVGKYSFVNRTISRSQWPRGLRRRSLAARLLRLWVRIPPGAWKFVCCECCVLSGRGLCDGLIIRSEESYRMWRVVVCDQETS